MPRNRRANKLYEPFVQRGEIENRTTKVNRSQSNRIVERLHIVEFVDHMREEAV